jgi:hypothetical protein
VTPEIFPKSLDFTKTPEKSLEYPDFADKIVFSGDFSGLAYSPPSRRHQNPFKASTADEAHWDPDESPWRGKRVAPPPSSGPHGLPEAGTKKGGGTRV